MRHPRRGLAIFTALLIVVLLYMTVTALVLQARQNLRLTQESHLRMQGEFLARGAVHTALASLNSDPSWFGAHPTLQAADVLTIDGQEARAWIEGGGSPEVFRLRGQAKVGTVTSEFMVSLYQQPLSQAAVVASSRRGGVYKVDPRAGSGWTALPTPPRLGWRRGQPIVGNPVPDEPEDIPREAVAGGPDGSLFVGTRVNLRGVVMMLPSGSSQWSLLPVLRLADGRRPAAVRQLAVAGERLYCVAGSGEERGELLYLDHPQNVQTLFDPETGTFTPAVGEWTRLNAPGDLTVQTVAASQNGQLYAKTDNGCYQVDPEAGRWQHLPPAPAQFWARTGPDEYELRRVDRDVERVELEGMTCDPQGNLYVNRQVDNVSTIFKYLPGAAPGPGSYRLLPAVRAAHGANDKLAHDYSGIFYTRVRKANAADQVLFTEGANGARPMRFAPLPETPNEQGTVDAIGPSGVYDLSRMRYVPQFSE